MINGECINDCTTGANQELRELDAKEHRHLCEERYRYKTLEIQEKSFDALMRIDKGILRLRLMIGGFVIGFAIGVLLTNIF